MMKRLKNLLVLITVLNLLCEMKRQRMLLILFGCVGCEAHDMDSVTFGLCLSRVCISEAPLVLDGVVMTSRTLCVST